MIEKIDNQNSQLDPSYINSVSSTVNPVVQLHHTSWWVISLWLLTFPPTAWYLIYKEKKYHKWFAYLLWFSAGLPLATIIPELIFVTPQLSSLYKTLNVSYSPANFYIGAIVLTLISVGEIIVGIILFIKTKESVDNYKKWIFIAIGLFIANALFMVSSVILSFASIILPIYNITNSIK